MYSRIFVGLTTLCVLAFSVGCEPADPVIPTTDTTSLIETDRAFCQRSLEAGMKVAFVEYADSSVIKMDDGQLAIRGIDSLRNQWAAPRPDGPSPLYWEPQHAEVSASGELGFTFGYWRFPAKTSGGLDTTYYGNYVSIWKRQPDGAWRYVLDTGTNTPKPEPWN